MLQYKEQIGRLDNLITFQKKVIGADVSFSDVELGWEDITDAQDFAAVRFGHGVETFQQDRVTPLQDVTFTLRYRNDLRTQYTVVCDGVRYNILAIKQTNRRGYIDILAESGGEYVSDSDVSGFTSGFDVDFD